MSKWSECKHVAKGELIPEYKYDGSRTQCNYAVTFGSDHSKLHVWKLTAKYQDFCRDTVPVYALYCWPSVAIHVIDAVMSAPGSNRAQFERVTVQCQVKQSDYPAGRDWVCPDFKILPVWRRSVLSGSNLPCPEISSILVQVGRMLLPFSILCSASDFAFRGFPQIVCREHEPISFLTSVERKFPRTRSSFLRVSPTSKGSLPLVCGRLVKIAFRSMIWKPRLSTKSSTSMCRLLWLNDFLFVFNPFMDLHFYEDPIGKKIA